MSDTENLADLVITFSAIDQPALAAFAGISSAGEEMVAAVTAATTETNAALASLASEADAAAASLTAALTEATAPLERVGAEAQQTAATVAEANARMTQVEREWAASSEQTAAAVATANERQAASFGALRDKVAADMAAMKTTEEEAAAANALVGEKMAGTAAGMGAMSVASAKGSAAYSNLASMAGLTGGQLTLLTAGAAAVAVGTTKMAADFQSSTQRLVSSAGEIDSNLDMVRQGILKLSDQTGYSSEQMSQSMYKIESGGQHGAAGLKVLQAAAEGARTENADMTTVADAVTSALTDYHLSADQAATVTSKLVAATASGKMTFEELAGSLANILPTASADHVALNDVLGDLASMTTHGMSAQRASQNLADTLNHMAAPTQVQAKELAALGLNATALSQHLGQQGLSGTLNTIQQAITRSMGPGSQAVVLNLTKALKGLDPAVQDLGMKLLQGTISQGAYTQAVKALTPVQASQANSFRTLAGSMHTIGTQQMSAAQVMQTYTGAMQKATGDSVSMRTALMLTGENSQTTAKAIKAVSSATTEAGNHVKGWAGIQQTFNQKAAEAKQSLHNMGTEIGTALLPAVTTAMGWISKGTQFFAEHKTAATVLAVVIGGVLVAGFVAAAVATATWAASMLALSVAGAPIWAIVLAVIALVAVVVLIVKHWGPIKDFFLKIWHGIEDGAKAVGHAIEVAWDATLNFFKKVGKDIGDFFKAAWDKIKDAWNATWKWFKGIPGDIKNLFKEAAQWLANAGHAIISGFLNGLKAEFDKVKDFVGGIGSWISSHKGPIEVDRVLLIPHGVAVMQGFHQGLQEQNGVVQAFVQSLPEQITNSLAGATTSAHAAGKSYAESLAAGIRGSQHLAVQAAQDIANQMGSAHGGIRNPSLGLGLGSTPLGGNAGAAGGTTEVTYQIDVHVAGSVWSTKELAAELQTEFSRIGMRNTSNGTNYLGFNRGSTTRPR